MGTIWTVCNMKGGSGKTTTAAALAQCASKEGRRVLSVDLDPQGNLSFTLGATQNGGTMQVLQGKEPTLYIQKGNAGDVLPGGPDLQTLKSGRGAALLLQKALSSYRHRYDLIIIDTPPTPGILQLNALQAADGVIIPLSPSIYAAQGLAQVIKIVREMQQSNSALHVLGVVVTQKQGRANVDKQVITAIKEGTERAGLPYLGEVRAAAAVREAQAMQANLYEYAPNSKPAQDYAGIYAQLTQVK